ncbi:MAG: nitroreductase family protein, partial [Chloroflexota bacterium]|nr:nitroreductase family protein [Chloroflexota bacterium]
MADYERLALPLGEAIFTQRAIRRVKPDAISDADLRLILEAAGRAPSATNRQPWHFIVIKDPALKAQMQAYYEEAWWDRRHAAGIHRVEDVPERDHPSLRLTREIGQAPVLVLTCQLEGGLANEVLAAVQNLLLAARGLGIGGSITWLGPSVESRVRQTFAIPDSAQIAHLVQMGYPQGGFGPAQRKALPDICSLDRWGTPA